MVNKKIMFGLLVLFLVAIPLVVLVTKDQTPDQKVDNQTSSEEIIKVNLGGSSEIQYECYQFRDNNHDPSYIEGLTTYVIEGTVTDIESKLKNEETKEINTYVTFAVDNYVKGEPFTNNEIQIVTCGGTIGDVTQTCMGSASAKRFTEGNRFKIYLEQREWNNETIYNVVCSDLGIEEI